MRKTTTHRRHTPVKKRTSSCYQRKLKKLTEWYNHLIEERKQDKINPNTKQSVKRKTIKDLDYYINLLKKVTGE